MWNFLWLVSLLLLLGGCQPLESAGGRIGWLVILPLILVVLLFLVLGVGRAENERRESPPTDDDSED